MISLQELLPFLNQREVVASLDLSDAYLRVLMHPSSQRFLRFCVNNQPYQFQVLPFGLTSSPRVFTKVIAPLVGAIHKKRIQVFPYLDDWLIYASSFSKANSHIQELCKILQIHRFLINVRKSSLVPTQDLVFIVGHFDMIKGQVV